MDPNDRDLPVSPDYAKSASAQSSNMPSVTPKMLMAGLGGAVVLMISAFFLWSHLHADPAAGNPLASRPGFGTLKKHVESLAEIDGLCASQDKLACYCELADRIRSDRQAIDSLLVNDPALRGFQISVRRPASVIVSYDLSKLPKAPEESECLNAVAAPTIIDDDAGTSGE